MKLYNRVETSIPLDVKRTRKAIRIPAKTIKELFYDMLHEDDNDQELQDAGFPRDLGRLTLKLNHYEAIFSWDEDQEGERDAATTAVNEIVDWLRHLGSEEEWAGVELDDAGDFLNRRADEIEAKYNVD